MNAFLKCQSKTTTLKWATLSRCDQMRLWDYQSTLRLHLSDELIITEFIGLCVVLPIQSHIFIWNWCDSSDSLHSGQVIQYANFSVFKIKSQCLEVSRVTKSETVTEYHGFCPVRRNEFLCNAFEELWWSLWIMSECKMIPASEYPISLDTHLMITLKAAIERWWKFFIIQKYCNKIATELQFKWQC